VAFTGKRTPEGGAYLAIGTAGGAGLLSALVIWEVLTDPSVIATPVIQEITWLRVGGFDLTFGIYLDQLAVVMLAVVAIVGTLVVIYSVGYMHQEGPTRPRYYAEISLFIGVMYGLVLASNYLFLYIFWELVGLCSYLLIGFWYERPAAAAAAKRAFIVTRVGDISLLVGLIILFTQAGTLSFSTLFDEAARPPIDPGIFTLATALIFGGAIGKSAQFPLHEWLPDAMEGPSTVSALIHAATMVKAGIYLVARTYPLLIETPDALLIVAAIGGITAFLAATEAVAANDIKRVIAFSTISQLGLMILALGAGGYVLAVGASGESEGYTAGIFHLLNHAFFKALMFLGAGSVIHAIHTNDLHAMGGLGRTMRITATTMMLGGLSLAGIPPLSGFWSKDEVLLSVYSAGSVHGLFYLLWLLGLLTSLLTAFYMFRLWFLAFSGKPRAGHAGKESPPVMTVPLLILGSLAAISGLILLLPNGIATFLHYSELGLGTGPTVAPFDRLTEIFAEPLNLLSIGVGVLGIGLAYAVYARGWIARAPFATGGLGRIQTMLRERYYLSWFYDAVGTYGMYGLARAVDWFDLHVIDGVVNGVAWVSVRGGRSLRRLQTGLVQAYAGMIVIGVCGLLILLFFLLPALGWS